MVLVAVILNLERPPPGVDSGEASISFHPNYSVGIVFVLVASLLSGVSAALTQKA